MKKLATVLYSEPVVLLSCVTGVVALLAREHLVASWVPLLVLAAVTPIQRALVTPQRKANILDRLHALEGAVRRH